ncbi:MAG: histidinol dehydrogenase [Clostridia bacterium]|nr:histidinol dehydrogenase [Clostridia bacterium]
MIKIYENCPVTEIFDRSEQKTDICDIVSDIIKNVRANGDSALFDYCEKFDKAHLSSLEVSDAEKKEALSETGEDFLSVLREAAENIRKFHINQKRSGFVCGEGGAVLGQKVIPLKRVGLYVPGGTASYPSTVLMNAIPAKIAGVDEIVITTPPSAEGKINPAVLAAAEIAGVSKIYKVGGAQAIAALCYGTETIKKVDKIVGPGNAFVAEAKKQVYPTCDIDMIAGPSEIMIIADSTCNPRFVAADMLSQAEHDKMATAVLATNSKELAEAVARELEVQIPQLERAEIARVSIDTNGKIIVVNSIEEAIDTANEIAPEHLEVCVDNPFEYLNGIRNAGSVFLGKYCPEALGDYFAGTNHTLPTSGTARFSSPLSVDDFVKKYSFTYYSKEALEKVNKKIDMFARKEGLTAHAKSATIRFEA